MCFFFFLLYYKVMANAEVASAKTIKNPKHEPDVENAPHDMKNVWCEHVRMVEDDTENEMHKTYRGS